MKFNLKSAPASFIKSTLRLFVKINLAYPEDLFALKNNSNSTMPGVAMNGIAQQVPILPEAYSVRSELGLTKQACQNVPFQNIYSLIHFYKLNFYR